MYLCSLPIEPDRLSFTLISRLSDRSDRSEKEENQIKKKKFGAKGSIHKVDLNVKDESKEGDEGSP